MNCAAGALCALTVACAWGCGSSVTVFETNGDEPSETAPSTNGGASTGGGGEGAAEPTDPVDPTAPVCPSGSALGLVASDQPGGSFIGVQDEFVYWSTDGALVRAAAVGGGPVESLASVALPMGFAIDEESAYFVTHDAAGVFRVDVGGGPVAVVSTLGGGGAFAMIRGDDEHLYVRGSCPELWRIDKSGASPTLLVSGEGCIGGIALDEEAVYYVSIGDGGGSIAKVSKQGGTPTLLAPAAVALAEGWSGIAPGIAVDEDNVYWVSDVGGFVARVPKQGGDVLVLASGIDMPQDLVVDDGWVYWSEYQRVAKVPREGGGVVTLAAYDGYHPLLDSILPAGLAIGGDFLYFTSYITSGPVLRLCK